MAKLKYAPRGPLKAKLEPQGADDPMEGRCTATNRKGERCRRWPIQGGYVCKMHGGGAPQVIAKAQERLAALVPKAVERLAKLIDRDEFPSVQFQASKAVIEFAEGKATERVEANVDAKIEVGWASE